MFLIFSACFNRTLPEFQNVFDSCKLSSSSNTYVVRFSTELGLGPEVFLFGLKASSVVESNPQNMIIALTVVVAKI